MNMMIQPVAPAPAATAGQGAQAGGGGNFADTMQSAERRLGEAETGGRQAAEADKADGRESGPRAAGETGDEPAAQTRLEGEPADTAEAGESQAEQPAGTVLPGEAGEVASPDEPEPLSGFGFFHGAPPAAQADEGRPLTAGQAPALAVGEQAGKAGRPDAGVAGEPEPSPVSGADEDALATEGDESAEAGPAEALARRGQEPRRQPERPGADKPEWLTQIELGQRWQSVQGGSEGGKMLPPDPAAAASREPRARSPVAPGREEPAPLVKAAVSLAGDAANAASPVPAAAADAGAATPASPTERLVAAERSLHLGASPEQGARQLSQQIQLMVNQNLQEADIRLSPSELGGLRIQLKMEQGEVNIQFTATQPQARELLEQALPRLREMLGQQGLAMGQGQVGGSAQQQGQQQGMAQQQEANPLPAGTGLPAAEEDGDWGTLESSRLATLAPGRIDFFA